MNKSLCHALLLVNLILASPPSMAASLIEAKQAIEAGDYAKAFGMYQTLASAGDAKAQYNLGMMYFRGDGVTQNYPQAVKWYRLSAEQGFVEAQYTLGVIYFKRDIIRLDYDEAIKWYRRAAEQGHARSQLNLGVIYQNGEVVEQDYSSAMQWYRRAAEQGNSEAQFNLGNMYANGEGADVDLVHGYMWLALSISNSQDPPNRINTRSNILNFTAAKMDEVQITEAKALTSQCASRQFKEC